VAKDRLALFTHHKDLESSAGEHRTAADGVGLSIALPALALFAMETADVLWPNYRDNGVFLLLEQRNRAWFQLG